MDAPAQTILAYATSPGNVLGQATARTVTTPRICCADEGPGGEDRGRVQARPPQRAEENERRANSLGEYLAGGRFLVPSAEGTARDFRSGEGEAVRRRTGAVGESAGFEGARAAGGLPAPLSERPVLGTGATGAGPRAGAPGRGAHRRGLGEGESLFQGLGHGRPALQAGRHLLLSRAGLGNQGAEEDLQQHDHRHPGK